MDLFSLASLITLYETLKCTNKTPMRVILEGIVTGLNSKIRDVESFRDQPFLFCGS